MTVDDVDMSGRSGDVRSGKRKKLVWTRKTWT